MGVGDPLHAGAWVAGSLGSPTETLALVLICSYLWNPWGAQKLVEEDSPDVR